jgi:hypothetical protein
VDKSRALGTTGVIACEHRLHPLNVARPDGSRVHDGRGEEV